MCINTRVSAGFPSLRSTYRRTASTPKNIGAVTANREVVLRYGLPYGLCVLGNLPYLGTLPTAGANKGPCKLFNISSKVTRKILLVVRALRYTITHTSLVISTRLVIHRGDVAMNQGTNQASLVTTSQPRSQNRLRSRVWPMASQEHLGRGTRTSGKRPRFIHVKHSHLMFSASFPDPGP